MENGNMSSEVFLKKELKKPNIFQRMFKQLPKENALIEVNNLLASKNIRDITESDMSDISERYRVNIHQTFLANLLEMYAAQLKYALIDKKLTEDELAELRALKELFGLSQRQVSLIHEQLAGDIYKRQVSSAVSDGVITEQEQKELQQLQNELCIPSELVDRISSQIKSTKVHDFVNGIISSGSISPNEEEEIKLLAKNLNCPVKLDSAQQGALNRMKMIWTIQNADLPTVGADIQLTSKEHCYFNRPAQWFQYKTVTQRVNYAGPTARIRICKGVSYRIGSARVQRITSEVLAPVDSGRMYVTDKRIVLFGGRKTSTIRLNKVVSFTPYSDGIELFKETGKSVIVKIDTDMELFNLLLSRLLRDCV